MAFLPKLLLLTDSCAGHPESPLTTGRREQPSNGPSSRGRRTKSQILAISSTNQWYYTFRPSFGSSPELLPGGIKVIGLDCPNSMNACPRINQALPYINFGTSAKIDIHTPD